MFHDAAVRGVLRVPLAGWENQRIDAPTAIGGCALWLSADQNLVTIPDTTTGAVSIWQDRSGNGNNALQATTANQPVWNANKINGLGAMIFTGASSQFFKSTFIDSMTTSGATIYIVGQYHGTSGTFVDASNGNTSANGLIAKVGGATKVSLAKAGFTDADSGATAADTNYIIECMSSQGAAVVSVNGTAGTAQNAINKTDYALDTYAIGSLSTAGTYLTGQIAEVIVFRGAKTQFERKLVRAWLSQKYCITST